MSWIEEQFVKSQKGLKDLFSKQIDEFTTFEKFSMMINHYNGINCNLLTACSVVAEPPQMVAARYYKHNGLERASTEVNCT